MLLQVFTARIGRWMKNDPDAIDITRKSARSEWLFLAPSWGILKPAIEARKRADSIMDAMKKEAERLGGYEDANGYPTFDPFIYQRDAEAVLEAAWKEYVPLFMAEMRVSHGMTQANQAWGNDEELAVAHGARANRPMWDNLLSRQRVILCCYCTDAEHCHRTILRRDILPKLGAEDCGEIKEQPRTGP